MVWTHFKNEQRISKRILNMKLKGRQMELKMGRTVGKVSYRSKEIEGSLE
jgi:hypothetical protein